MDFIQKVRNATEAKGSSVVVGLDPHLVLLPAPFAEKARRGLSAAAVQIQLFLSGIVDATRDLAVGVKLQSAFFETLGPAGIEAFAAVAEHAQRSGLVVIGDVKRGDIGSTAEAYAAAYLGPSDAGSDIDAAPFSLDAITVSPYLGEEGLIPFVEACARHGKGLFVLVRTSNPSSDAVQARRVDSASGPQVFEIVAETIARIAEKRFPEGPYQPVGAVAGATYPEDLKTVRQALPRSLLLVPGYGAQGATAADLVAAFDANGFGALVNASRSITFAHRWDESGRDPFQAARAAAERMRDEIAEQMRIR